MCPARATSTAPTPGFSGRPLPLKKTGRKAPYSTLWELAKSLRGDLLRGMALFNGSTEEALCSSRALCRGGAPTPS